MKNIDVVFMKVIVGLCLLLKVVLLSIFISLLFSSCKSQKQEFSYLDPIVARLETELQRSDLDDSLRILKQDSLRNYKRSQAIAQQVIMNLPKKVKKSNLNIAIGGNVEAAQATGDTKVKDQSKVKERTKTITKTTTKTAPPWWMWPLIIALILLNAYQVFRRFWPVF